MSFQHFKYNIQLSTSKPKEVFEIIKCKRYNDISQSIKGSNSDSIKMTKTNCLTYKCIFILMNGFIRMKKKF